MLWESLRAYRSASTLGNRCLCVCRKNLFGANVERSRVTKVLRPAHETISFVMCEVKIGTAVLEVRRGTGTFARVQHSRTRHPYLCDKHDHRDQGAKGRDDWYRCAAG